MPKWSTSERRLALVELWARYGNKCLLGHSVCTDLTHYIHSQPIALHEVKLVKVKCKDRNGNDILDSQGNPLYADTFQDVTCIIHKDSIQRLYELKETEVVKDWIADDRQSRTYINRMIAKSLHRLNERGSTRGQFNAISRDIYFDSQPQFYIESLGVSGLTFKPFAKIRIASGYTRLHVTLDNPLKGLSKNAKRKAIRYRKPLPVEMQQDVDRVCRLAVAKFLSK